jgi:hypothetical protein
MAGSSLDSRGGLTRVPGLCHSHTPAAIWWSPASTSYPHTQSKSGLWPGTGLDTETDRWEAKRR